MEGFGERLRIAIDTRVGSVRKFEKELTKHAPGLRGTSRQSLYRYFHGTATPNPGVARAAAEGLGVREEWLADDDGEMTEEERERERQRRERTESGGIHPERDIMDRFFHEIRRRVPDPRMSR